MTSLKMLPVGIENFKEIRRDGFYYVDKTNLIKELLESRGKANLFTRPRRFGKSLTKSMLIHTKKKNVKKQSARLTKSIIQMRSKNRIFILY